MSESAPERTGGRGADSFFSRKYGPLPAWGWITLAAAGAGAYILYRRRRAATTTAASTDTGGSTSYDYAPQIATLQEEIQDLQSGGAQTPTLPPPLSSSGSSTSGFSPQPGTPSSQPSSNPQASVFSGAPVAAAVFTAPSASAGTGTITASRPATTTARPAPAPAPRPIIPTTPPRIVPTRLPLGISVNNAQRLGIPRTTIVAGSRPPQNLPLGLSVNNARRLGL